MNVCLLAQARDRPASAAGAAPSAAACARPSAGTCVFLLPVNPPGCDHNASSRPPAARRAGRRRRSGRARRPPAAAAAASVVDDAKTVRPAQCPRVLVRLAGHVPRDARVAVDDAARTSNIHLLVRRLVVPFFHGARPSSFQEISREGAGIFPRRRPERQRWRRAPRERQRPSQSQGRTPLGVRETVAQRRVARLICQPAVVAPKGMRLRLPVDGTLGRQERLAEVVMPVKKASIFFACSQGSY